MCAAVSDAASPTFAIERYGVIARPDPADPTQAGGILNPGCARGPDGALYLFPRLVAEGTRSVIGVGRVRFDPRGIPVGLDFHGVALAAEEPYERASPGVCGCEDARVTYVPALNRYIMTYVALTATGPRVALAHSPDLRVWERLGLAHFHLESDVHLNSYSNKDAVLFPEPVVGPDGQPALALIHRPMYLLNTSIDQAIDLPAPHGIVDRRQSMWISYANLDAVGADLSQLTELRNHCLLATPETGWENVKIGAGAPPVLTHLGWLLVYHGVERVPIPASQRDNPAARDLCYRAGAMILDPNDPRRVIYRSARPVLAPDTNEERCGVVSDVVFPTGLDPRFGRGDSSGPGTRMDVYYGMADGAIGAGWLRVPETLPGA